MNMNKKFADANKLLLQASAIRSEAHQPHNSHNSVNLMLDAIAKEDEARLLLRHVFGPSIDIESRDED